MNQVGSGGVGFVIGSGTLLAIGIVILAVLAFGGWMVFRK